MKLKNTKVFITGGAGFVGSNLAKRFYREGASIRIFDNFTSGKKENISSLLNNIEIIKGDILNKEHLLRAMKGADIVSHHAAQLEITRALKHPEIDLDINTKGTLNMLEGCVKNKVKKLINASSACVYGQKSRKATSEGNPTEPNWEYGISKLASEKYCQIYGNRYGFRVVSFRYAIIYGENEWYGRVMTIFIKRALNNKPLIIFGDGQQRRDFIHISDVVEANYRAILSDNIRNDVLNISTGIGTTIKKLATIVKYNVNNDIKIYFDKEVNEGEKSKYIDRLRLPSELQNMILSNIKLKKTLGYTPGLSVEKGIKRQIAWASKNLMYWDKMSY